MRENFQDVCYLQEDDFGQRGGDSWLPNSAEARQEVENWNITAFGGKPEYYLVRDLLFSSLLRDKRVWPFHKLCGKDYPSWMMSDTFGMPEPHRKLIRHYRAFHWLHICYLTKLLRSADESTASYINSLKNCWPLGVKVEWNGPRQKTSHDVCRHAWQCPWCFARNVVNLYKKILLGPLRSGGERYYAVATADVPVSSNNRCVSDVSRFRTFQKQVKKSLIEKLRTVGAGGGIVSSQLGPRQLEQNRWECDEIVSSEHDGFDFHFGVIGEITRQSRTANRSFEPINIEGLTLRPQIAIRKGRPEEILRKLLAGHSRSYTGDQRLPDGRGLFRWPSLILANYTQWHQHLNLTRDLHSYDAWGSWIGKMPSPQPFHISNGRHRGARFRQRNNSVNYARSSEARCRREEYVERFRGLWERARCELDCIPGRKRFRDVLTAQGESISDRDLRAIIKIFKAELDTTLCSSLK